ncbi:MAG: DUF1499 domain-containing protein [Gracilimonas sp.]|nr:DUF1499 domain-containing protein [Gracilimonas sp.]
MKPATTNKLLTFGTALSVLGALTVFFSGYGYQWGWWHFGTGFSMIPWGTAGAVIGGIVAAVGFFKSPDRNQNQTVVGLIAVGLASLALLNIGYWYSEIQKGYPPIHDISTDLVNPPEFRAIAPLREEAPNPVEYAGAETAEAQREFYTDLSPITVSLSYEEAYERALEAARDMPWILVGESKNEGRIEAYEKLAWYGFIDDVVIRVDTTETGSRIDIRSKSRIGRGDLGVNAKRIKSYIAEFQD